MKKLLAKIAMVAMLGSMLFVAPVSTQAVTVPLWDVTGSYVFSFEYGGSYLHDVTLTQDGLGNLTGSGGHPAGGPHVYTWVLTSGSVSGNTITFTADYTASADAVTPQTTMTVTGTIAPDGTMSGAWSDNYQGSTRNGTWSTTGAASSINNTTIVVTPPDMALNLVDVSNDITKWFFYNDRGGSIDGPEGINNSIGSFVNGPEISPLGLGSVQISVPNEPVCNIGPDVCARRNLATYQFKDVKLSNISILQFSTYAQSVGDGALGLSERAPYLQFNVDFNNSDNWQRRLTYVPALNGVVVADEWQTWDAINGGNAMWTYSGSIWPGTGDSGSSPKTWAQILALYPNAETRSTDSFLGFRVGEPYSDGFTGNVDNFMFGTNAGVTTFDFDPVPPNLAPVADNTSITTDENTAISSNLTATDANLPPQTLAYSIVDNPIHGTISGFDSATGAYTYTPDLDYFGSDSFTFKANDGLLDSNVATVSITVEPIPAPTNKDQCKNDGWKLFTHPAFKNQGQCVAYTNHLE